MTTHHQRPINLELSSLKFPPMAIASILHRISGLVLFLLLPVMMYFLSVSLRSVLAFEELQMLLLHPVSKLVIWAFSTALIYHVLAGFRHIIMDVGLGEQLMVAKRSAIAVIVLSIILTIFLGIWIW